jgi:hypothetical protein
MPQIVLQPAWALAIAATHANMSAATRGYPLPDLPYFVTQGCHPGDVGFEWGNPVPEQRAIFPPAINWTLWNGSDDIATFLNTQDIVGGWNLITVDTIPTDYAGRDGNPVFPGTTSFVCTIPSWMLPYVSGLAWRHITIPRLAPVWPGLDHVSFGDPVPLATGVTLTEPMHGVVLSMTTIPPEMEHSPFDETDSWYRTGQIVFENDDGACEDFQFFSFEKQILTPRRMQSASACHIRCALGIEGTVTSWWIVETPS